MEFRDAEPFQDEVLQMGQDRRVGEIRHPVHADELGTFE